MFFSRTDALVFACRACMPDAVLTACFAEACRAEIDEFVACAELKNEGEVAGRVANDLEHPFYKATQCAPARQRSEQCVLDVGTCVHAPLPAVPCSLNQRLGTDSVSGLVGRFPRGICQETRPLTRLSPMLHSTHLACVMCRCRDSFRQITWKGAQICRKQTAHEVLCGACQRKVTPSIRQPCSGAQPFSPAPTSSAQAHDVPSKFSLRSLIAMTGSSKYD